MTRDTLHTLIDHLPEDKLEQALSLLTELTQTKSSQPKKDRHDLLDSFLADLLSALSSITYDLSKEAEKNNDKILATHFAFSMKKVVESWENYKAKSKNQ
ncbi:MAG: hypothetical protein LLG02_09850 [Pelosinus sp.]|nr:hypothetical protein [Pelosinus sp.]